MAPAARRRTAKPKPEPAPARRRTAKPKSKPTTERVEPPPAVEPEDGGELEVPEGLGERLDATAVGDVVAFVYHDDYAPAGGADVAAVGIVVAVVDVEGDTRAAVAWLRDISDPIPVAELYAVDEG